MWNSKHATTNSPTTQQFHSTTQQFRSTTKLIIFTECTEHRCKNEKVTDYRRCWDCDFDCHYNRILHRITGHGAGGGSKGGYKKATEAAEAALTAEYTGDAAAMMKLLPAKGKEYWEDDKNLTEKQLQDYMQNRMNTYGHKYDEVSVKVDDNSNPIENSKVTERVNSNYLDNYGITADEVIYFAECELTVDGEERDEGNDVYVYKYNGRWYSIYPEYHLIEDTDSE